MQLARVISGQSRLLGSANLVTRSGHVFQDAAGVPSRDAYVAAGTDVTDPEQYEQYKAASPTAIAAGGDRFSSMVASSSSLRATGSRLASLRSITGR